MYNAYIILLICDFLYNCWNFILSQECRGVDVADIVESSLSDQMPVNAFAVEDSDVTYQVLADVTQRSRNKLFDGLGYSYTVKRHYGKLLMTFAT